MIYGFSSLLCSRMIDSERANVSTCYDIVMLVVHASKYTTWNSACIRRVLMAAYMARKKSFFFAAVISQNPARRTKTYVVVLL